MRRPSLAALVMILVRKPRTIALYGVVAATLLIGSPADAVTLGVIGDSISDEYAEETYSYAENWVEQLAAYGGVNVGPTGSWGPPRRTQFEYNWARAGATSDTLISGGQATGLAGQVVPKAIDYAVMMVGANDFFPFATWPYDMIYSETWTATDIQNYVNQRISNVDIILNTITTTGVPLVMANFPDYAITPYALDNFTDAAKRDLVTAAIAQVNVGLESLAQSYEIVLFDLFDLSKAVWGTNSSPNASVLVGNVTIDLTATDTATGTNPTAGFVHDGIHPSTVMQGTLANMFLEGLNIGYGAGLTPFTEAEILSHAGITYGGLDTLVAQFGNPGDYITNYVPATVPEPTTALLLACGLVGLGVRRRLH